MSRLWRFYLFRHALAVHIQFIFRLGIARWVAVSLFLMYEILLCIGAEVNLCGRCSGLIARFEHGSSCGSLMMRLSFGQSSHLLVSRWLLGWYDYLRWVVHFVMLYTKRI